MPTEQSTPFYLTEEFSDQAIAERIFEVCRDCDEQTAVQHIIRSLKWQRLKERNRAG